MVIIGHETDSSGSAPEAIYAVFRVFAPDSGLLLKSPHVEVLAEQLKACLEQARSESEQPGPA